MIFQPSFTPTCFLLPSANTAKLCRSKISPCGRVQWLSRIHSVGTKSSRLVAFLLRFLQRTGFHSELQALYSSPFERLRCFKSIPLFRKKMNLSDGSKPIVHFFFKFGPHSKIQFENGTSFTRRFTGKTGEISSAHFTING